MPRWAEERRRTEPTPRDGKGQRAFQGTTAVRMSMSPVNLLPGNALGDYGPGGLGLTSYACRCYLQHALSSLSSLFPVQRRQTWVGISDPSKRGTGGHCGQLLSAHSPWAVYLRSPTALRHTVSWGATAPCSLQPRAVATQENREALQLAQVSKLAPGLEATLE